MRVGQALRLGWIQVSSTKRLLAFITVANLAVALLVGFPFYRGVRGQLGSSAKGELLAERFDREWLGEFLFERKGPAASFEVAHAGPAVFLEVIETWLSGKILTLESSLLVLGLFYMVLYTFFAGGLLGVYHAGRESFLLHRFFENGGRYFGRFLRLLVISTGIYIVLLKYLGTGSVKLLEEWTLDSPSDKPLVFFSLGYAAAFGFLLAVVSMVLDYTRIVVVVERRRSVAVSLVRALVFLFQYPTKVISLYLWLALFGAAGMLGFAALDSALAPTGLAILVPVFLLQQIYIFYKIGLRAALYASEMGLYKGLTAEAASAAWRMETSAEVLPGANAPASRNPESADPSST